MTKSKVAQAKPAKRTRKPATKGVRTHGKTWQSTSADGIITAPDGGGYAEVKNDRERRIANDGFSAGIKAQKAGTDALLAKIKRDVLYSHEGNEGDPDSVLEKAVSAVANDLETLAWACGGEEIVIGTVERALIIAHNRLRSAARLHKLLNAPKAVQS